MLTGDWTLSDGFAPKQQIKLLLGVVSILLLPAVTESGKRLGHAHFPFGAIVTRIRRVSSSWTSSFKFSAVCLPLP